MKTHIFAKTEILTPAFAARDGTALLVSRGVTVDKSKPVERVPLPKRLEPGTDYLIRIGNKALTVTRHPGKLPEKTIGGFHVGLNGAIAAHSIWDLLFRSKSPDLRAQIFATELGGFWGDVYPLNIDPHLNGTSKAGVEIADGRSHVMLPDGVRGPLNHYNAVRVFQAHGKELLSREEFAVLTDGVEINRSAGSDPVKTGHIPGLKSRYGAEQATGCMWTWSRDVHPDYNGFYLMGGSWYSSDSGPRRLNNVNPGSGWYSIGARGRCDHLFPAGREAVA